MRAIDRQVVSVQRAQIWSTKTCWPQGRGGALQRNKLCTRGIKAVQAHGVSFRGEELAEYLGVGAGQFGQRSLLREGGNTEYTGFPTCGSCVCGGSMVTGCHRGDGFLGPFYYLFWAAVP